MVDVGFVVVNETPSGTVPCFGCYVPVEFGRHRCLGFVLHFDYEILHLRGNNLAVVVDFEFTNEEVVVGLLALHAKTDALDDIVGAEARDVNLLLFPSLARGAAVGHFNPVVATLLLDDNREESGRGTFLTVLDSEAYVGCAAADLEVGLVEDDVGTVGHGRTRQLNTRTTRVSIFVSVVGHHVGGDGGSTRLIY